ncbi:unnamed protein product [Rhizopus stolonifer]
MRLLALEYGADLVWTEELVDKRIIGSIREYNQATGTVDYRKGKNMVFSTHPDEKGKVILQLGTADPDLALKAAQTLEQDVAGIDSIVDVPKSFLFRVVWVPLSCLIQKDCKRFWKIW